MKPLRTLQAIAAPLPEADVDTDQIIPARFMKRSRQEGFADQCFYDRRYDSQGHIKQDFVLNYPTYNKSRILVSGSNFGCGSSREHAVWALQDYGIICVIAPSFGDIFYANSLQNGLIPISLPLHEVEEIFSHLESVHTRTIRIDLEGGAIFSGECTYRFHLDPYWRHLIMSGRTMIEKTLDMGEEISRFESVYRVENFWLFE